MKDLDLSRFAMVLEKDAIKEFGNLIKYSLEIEFAF